MLLDVSGRPGNRWRRSSGAPAPPPVCQLYPLATGLRVP
ncbi:hypothetical protein YT1_2995 [Rhodococcus ruber]|nr:hypothetical protein YT1_2995 [Rhodococcus ruber]